MISILNKYLIKQFLKSFLAILFFITFVIYAAESIELFRRIGSYDSVSFFDVFYLSFLKVPKTIQILLPFIFLFAGMGTFSNLTKNKELMVMRAAGMSAFKIIMPIAIFSLILGFIYIFFFNPIFANMTHKFKIEKASLLGFKEDIFDISGKGIWIRDGGDKDSYFIYAASMNKEGRQFKNVTFYRYRDQQYMDRIDSDMAILNPGDWVLQQPIITPFDAPSYQEDVLHLISTIQFEKIPDYLIDPEGLSFWQLSDYIKQLRQHHFKSDRYEIYYHSILAKPFLFLGMVLFSGIFSFQRNRLGQKTTMIIGGVGSGLMLFFFNNIMLILGLNEMMPLFIAAWGSTYLVLAISFFILSKIEE